MSQVEKLTVFFVLRSEDGCEDDSSDDMKLAYNTVTKYGANAKWIQPSSCSTSAFSSADVFVLEKFEGDVFEELKKHSAKILGARCILTCLTSGRSIPNSPTPVFSEGMRDLVICCTGFHSLAKKQLQEKVEFMAGIYVKSLRAVTTHLVAHNNISTKAIEAYKSNLPIMKCSWIEAVWEKSQHYNINGSDEEFKSYISPLFHNLTITTSGIGKKEKEKIKELVESNGGTFTGVLTEKSTNILIVAKPEGDKFVYAKSWNIYCLKPSWIYDCVASQTIHPLESYIVEQPKKGNPKSSTPKKEDVECSVNFSMMSAIAQEPDRMVTHLEETGFSFDSVKSQLTASKPSVPAVSTDIPSVVINNILLKNSITAGSYLDGIHLYLCGFNTDDLEQLKKLMNVAGAVRFNEPNQLVTHIVVGRKTNSVLSSLKNISAHILSLDWIVESMKLGRPAPVGDFLVVNTVKSAEPPSPLSKLGAKLLTTVENKTIDKPQFSLDQEMKKLAQMEEEELLHKYKQSQPGEPLAQRENPYTRSNNTSFQSRASSSQPSPEFYKGVSFFLSSELMETEKKELEQIINIKGGTVVHKRFLGVPDYAVVPISGASLSEMTTKEVVNVFFIKDCCFEECIVPIQYYHQPVTCVRGATPLKDCVISVSNYVQCEREFMESLIEILGACPQSLLARKPKENILKSTHLVCADATGQKYNGAVRWGLPVVHHDWLLKCAALGTRVSEEPYLVGQSKLQSAANETKDEHHSRLAAASKCDDKSPAPVPDRALPLYSQSKQQDLSHKSINGKESNLYKDSPVHSAVSKLKNTQLNSPDLNRTLTPTSPYGAFYGNDNPSPGTRKRLWKWMHQGAEFPQDPPMNYKFDQSQQESTPLSSLLTDLLVDMKRKPEDIPKDSPVTTIQRRADDLESNIPFKKLNLDQAEPKEETEQENNMKHNSLITTGLQKMKEIEENYAKNCNKPSTPVRKQSDSAPQMLVVTESQPYTEVGWEDPNEKEIALKKLEKAAQLSDKIFMLTRLDDTEQTAKLIKQCGGKMSPLPHFDKNATHLISKDLIRDEKLIASIAAGLWVLHPSYIEELEIVRDVHKVSEEYHEWGNTSAVDRTVSLPANLKVFATCSVEWRLAIKQGCPPPFKDIKIILHLRPAKYDNFKRLIEAGSGVVVSAKPPYNGDVDADVVVVDTGHTEEIDYEALASKNIPCVTTLYFSDRILKKPNAIEKNILPPFMKFWRPNNVMKPLI